jgi:predicted ATPase
MLTGLRVQNFKSWKDSGDIRLAPVTVLFGANSSGKTSLIQFLLMLRQTVESTDRRRVLDLGGGANSLVDLGTFTDTIYNHDDKSDLTFEIGWKIEDRFIGLPAGGEPVRSLTFGARVGLDPSEGIALRSFHYEENYYTYTIERALNGRYAAKYTDDEGATRDQHMTGEPGKFYIPQTEFRYAPDKYSVFSATPPVREFENQFSLLTHVGPMREEPKRIYIWAGATPADVGRFGERAIEALLADQIAGSAAPATNDGSREILQEQVGRWLREMGVIHSFELRELGHRIYQALVRVKPDSPEVLLTDVGFGVSQVLPVLVQSYYAKRGSTVIFEQPEIHLHPSVQSHLADVFIDAAKTQGVQFLIESHSEHLLRRLQRRIAEGSVTADDVALYFVEYGAHGSRLRPLELDDVGNIKNWPDGFFGDDITDIATLARITAERRLREARDRANG